MKGVGEHDLLVAFDGTWAEDTWGPEEDDTVLSRVCRAWPGRTVYVPGVGTRLGPIGRVVGGMFGYGGKERMEEALWGIEAWHEDHPESKLFVAGWSRGGVLAYGLSQAVQATIVPTLTLLLDPVPGPSLNRWWHDSVPLGQVVVLKARKPRNPFFARMRVKSHGAYELPVSGASHTWVGRSLASTSLVRGLLIEAAERSG